MERVDINYRTLYAIDFKHNSFPKFIEKYKGYSYLTDKRLHRFWEETGIKLHPLKLQSQTLKETPNFIDYECISITTYSELKIDFLKRNAVKIVANFCSAGGRLQRDAIKKREELIQERKLVQDNPTELRKLKDLYSFELEYMEKKEVFTFEQIKNIIHVPYKIIFLKILIDSYTEVTEKHNNYLITKFITELKILITSLQNTLPTKNEISKSKISLPHQIALLNEIGFFELDYFKNITDTKRNIIISKLLNTNTRSVKGNISALNPKSNENPSKYTSYNYMDEVKKYLFQL
tara:strand:- start:838 stop:1713 length:876 start_codon:yes stop_codon:yes gene_type:complete